MLADLEELAGCLLVRSTIAGAACRIRSTSRWSRTASWRGSTSLSHLRLGHHPVLGGSAAGSSSRRHVAVAERFSPSTAACVSAPGAMGTMPVRSPGAKATIQQRCLIGHTWSRPLTRGWEQAFDAVHQVDAVRHCITASRNVKSQL